VRGSLRARFALLAGALVLAVATLVALGGYLTMRHALLSRAERAARDQARQLAATVDTPSAQGASANANQVDIADPALTHELAPPGFIVEVTGPMGAPIQASATGIHGAPARVPAGFVADCLRTGGGHAQLSRPPLALACERVGSNARPIGTVSVGAPLADVLASLATLRDALAVGVLGGCAAGGRPRAAACAPCDTTNRPDRPDRRDDPLG
jgi:hypothetical protein